MKRKRQNNMLSIKELILWLQSPTLISEHNRNYNKLLSEVKRFYDGKGQEVRIYRNKRTNTLYEVVINAKRIIVKTQADYMRYFNRQIAGACLIDLA